MKNTYRKYLNNIMNINYLNTVKKMLLTQSKNVMKVNFEINNYNDVLKEFKKFKIKKNNENFLISNIFTFHLNNNNHILLYHKKYYDNCLLLCKINNIYKYILIPCNNIIFDKEIVATYS